MKLILAFNIFVFASMVVQGQTSRGSLMTGGSFNIQHSAVDNPNGSADHHVKSVTISFNPTVGYFPINNLFIGVETSYSHSWRSDGTYTSNDIGGGPLLRYYFCFKNFAVFPEGNANFSKSRFEYTTTLPVFPEGSIEFTSGSVLKKTQFRAGVGFVWFITPNVGVEVVIAYRKTNAKDPQAMPSTDISDVYTNAGFQFYFSRKE